MLRNAFTCARKTNLAHFSTQVSSKPPLKLVAELRKLTEVSIIKAREALSATENDVSAALKWLEQDLITSGAKRAAKVEGRETKEGMISVSILSSGMKGSQIGLGCVSEGIRAAMVELNCETDFVGRNELFGNLAADIAHTAAFISDPVGADTLFTPCPLDLLIDTPLISQKHPHQSNPSATVGSSIRDMIAKVGEKISLRRAVTVVQNPIPQSQGPVALRLASYLHGSVNSPTQGRIGALAVLALKSPHLAKFLASEKDCTDLMLLERSLARQIVGFDTRMVQPETDADSEVALYQQPFMMLAGELSGQPVQQVLKTWALQKGLAQGDTSGIEVMEFAKWSVGEPLETTS